MGWCGVGGGVDWLIKWYGMILSLLVVSRVLLMLATLEQMPATTEHDRATPFGYLFALTQHKPPTASSTYQRAHCDASDHRV